MSVIVCHSMSMVNDIIKTGIPHGTLDCTDWETLTAFTNYIKAQATYTPTSILPGFLGENIDRDPFKTHHTYIQHGPLPCRPSEKQTPATTTSSPTSLSLSLLVLSPPPHSPFSHGVSRGAEGRGGKAGQRLSAERLTHTHFLEEASREK